ncbi:hypothetical protein J2I47_25010 [Fibrella sp. HMF5335]|uniref:Uncharacterized protein n=1 Tax=Fibrella rubiginis TaxID=2817060 RepID=A0A939GIR6_9BACT|nr:hypothetical protein [Fibrella rubiginis]MBO0939829.1 hypothetical protein [Fibrella rubiginis]
MKHKQVLVAADRVWDIDGYPNYFLDAQGRLYRLNARGEIIVMKRAVKRYTVDYVLKSRFFSLSQLRQLLRRHLPINPL